MLQEVVVWCLVAVCAFSLVQPTHPPNQPTPHPSHHTPSLEPGFGAGPESAPRPVVRVRDAAAARLSKIFTRVQPDSRSTSILIRIREGWDELRRMLLPDARAASPNPRELKQRMDVYICTTAERQYALEAWRLLDPGHMVGGRWMLVTGE
jgi:hypothetical protein